MSKKLYTKETKDGKIFFKRNITRDLDDVREQTKKEFERNYKDKEIERFEHVTSWWCEERKDSYLELVRKALEDTRTFSRYAFCEYAFLLKPVIDKTQENGVFKISTKRINFIAKAKNVEIRELFTPDEHWFNFLIPKNKRKGSLNVIGKYSNWELVEEAEESSYLSTEVNIIEELPRTNPTVIEG